MCMYIYKYVMYAHFCIFAKCIGNILGTKLQVQGQLLVDPAPLDVRVLNSGRDFLRVRAHVQGQGAGGRRSDTGAMNIGDLT